MEKSITLTRVLDQTVRLGVWILLLLAPLKWGLPVLDPDKSTFPMGPAEWLVGSWPAEVFCLAVYFLFFLRCLRMLLGDRIPRATPSWILWGPILFIFSSITAGFFSAHPSVSISCNLMVLAYLLLFLLILWQPDALEFWMGSFLISSGVVALIAIFQRFSGFSQTMQWAAVYMSDHPQLELMRAKLQSGRVFSTFIYPNSLGGYLIMCLPVVGWFWWKSMRGLSSPRTVLKTAAATLLVTALMAGLLALYLSGSQGAFLILGVIGAGVLFLSGRQKWRTRKFVWILGACVLALAATLCWITPDWADHVKWTTLLMRFSYWAAAVKMALSRWWLGYGPGTFGIMYPQFKLDWAGETQFAHGDALQVFTELGIVGLAGWLCWWAGWIFKRRQFPVPMGGAVAVGLSAFLLHGLLDFDFFVPGITIQALFLCAFLWSERCEVREERIVWPADTRPWGRWILGITAAVILVVVPHYYFHRCAQAQACYAQGISFANEARWKEARDAFSRAAVLRPGIPAYRFTHGLMCENGGEPPAQVLQSYRAACLLAPNVAYYHYRAGLAAAACPDMPQAIAFLRAACRCYPGKAEYILTLKALEKESR